MKGLIARTQTNARMMTKVKQTTHKMVIKKHITRCFNVADDKPKLTTDELYGMIKTTIHDATDIVVGDTEKEKKAWCVRRLYKLLESFDNFIPVVGMYLDNPIADDLEEKAIEILVDWGWDKFHSNKESPTTTYEPSSE